MTSSPFNWKSLGCFYLQHCLPNYSHHHQLVCCLYVAMFSVLMKIAFGSKYGFICQTTGVTLCCAHCAGYTLLPSTDTVFGELISKVFLRCCHGQAWQHCDIYFKCLLEVLLKKPDRLAREEWLSHRQSPGLFELPTGTAAAGILEELQRLWRWQPRFPDSSGQGDKEAGGGAGQHQQGPKHKHTPTLWNIVLFFSICV